MYITVDMVFRKRHIRCFVESLSIHKHKERGIIEFEKGDKLNSLIRSYLIKIPEHGRPLFGREVCHFIIPLFGAEKNYLSHSYLPKSEWVNLESDLEDLFFRLFYEIEKSGSVVSGKRKFAREKFLSLCGITEDVMTEDSFRKSYDRFIEKKAAKIHEFLENETISIITIYKTAI
jgi:hypothetical protein